MAFIYKIENNINHKVYIGETLNPEERWSRHLTDLRHNKHHSNKLQRAFNKYGENVFWFEVIAEVNNDTRYEDEKQYIQQYNSYNLGYNETTGGDNPGYEKKQKVVYCYDFNGNYLDEWYISGREASRILSIDQALLQKICVGQRKSAYDAQGRRLRFSYKLVDFLDTIESNYTGKKSINQYDLEGNLINIFECKGDAAEFLGLSRNSRGGLIRAIKNQEPYHGSIWKEN